MKTGLSLTAMIAAILAGFVGLNLAASATLDSVRLDLTERGLYRLSDGTREILRRLDEPVSLSFYYSRGEAAGYPAVRAYAARVRELLRGIAAASGGRVRLEEIDPEPFSQAEDRAIAAGLEPIPAEGGTSLFFGLVGRNAVDDARVIAVFDPAREARLEYDIAALIAALERARKPRVALISSLSLPSGEGANPLIADLEAAFEVTRVEADFEALPDADALIILHPGELSDAQLYRIDQFALTRGRVFAALDPMAHIALKPGPDGLPPLRASRASDLPRLLARWGAAFDDTVTVMDRENGLPVQVIEEGRPRTRAYPLWFSIPPAGFADDAPSVAALSRGINLGSPGLIKAIEGSGVEMRPLLTSSRDAARLDADIAAGSPAPAELLSGYAPADDAPLVIAARFSGRIETAFPNGPPAADIAFDPSAHRDEGEAEIVLIADADWLDAAFFTRQGPGGAEVVADNAAFALNAMDRLAGDPALVDLRSRAPSERRMRRVDALRAEAESRYLALQTELEADLQQAEEDLARLNAQGAGSVLSGARAEDAERAEALRAEILETRARLRDIERGFRTEIDALERRLLIWTVWAPALGVALLALGIAGGRAAGRALRRRRSARSAAP